MRAALCLFVLLALVASPARASGASDVVDLVVDNFDTVVGQGDGVFVEFFAPWCGHCKSLAPEYEIVGTAFKNINGVKIAKVDADAEKSLGSRFGVKGFPTLKWFPAGSTTPVDYEGGRTADDIVKFVNEKAGTNARVKKVPTAVTVLDPSNFDAIVMDPTKDVLVEFYAPWCGHCKSLAPVYEKVAQSLEGETSVVVANLDADKHRELAEKYDVTGFPTLKWFPKGNKEGEAYSGGRAATDFLSFFQQKSGVKRTVGGGVTTDAGQVAALSDLVKRFVAEPDARVSIRAEAESVAASVAAEDAAAAKYHLLVMKKVLEKGDSFVSAEALRLQRMVDSGNLLSAKKLQFMININILQQFTAASA